jgi:hypothetical protein
MIRKLIAALLAVSPVLPASAAAVPARLTWKVGQVLTYKVEHSTHDRETGKDGIIEHKTSLLLTKSWQVVEIDADGVATVRLFLRQLVWEMTKADGTVLRYDSTDPEKSDKEMREWMDKLMKAPIAVLRIDPLGRVVQVLQSRHGPASRYELELPFVAWLPEGGFEPGKTWERQYTIVLEPPQGAGEKFPAVQRYTAGALEGSLAKVSLTTALKSPPEAATDQMPLLDKLPEGEVIFDLAAGRLQKATLRVNREIKNYMGEGTNYQVRSNYTEEYVGDR